MVPSAEQWRERAACRKTKVEMVPAGAVKGVRRAKKVCGACPVQVKCLLDAEKMTLGLGAEHAQGIRGGLTEQERATMAGLGRLPEPCTRCGIVCVPINLDTTECSACAPGQPIHYDDYRLPIEQMLRAGSSYQEIADRLRLKKTGVTTACGRWKLKAKKRSTRRARADLQECGTLAAKYRHHRKEPYSWRDCPQCRFVPWNKGAAKTAA